MLDVDYVLKDLQRFYLFYHSLERFFCKINGNCITVVNNVCVSGNGTPFPFPFSV